MLMACCESFDIETTEISLSKFVLCNFPRDSHLRDFACSVKVLSSQRFLQFLARIQAKHQTGGNSQLGSVIINNLCFQTKHPSAAEAKGNFLHASALTFCCQDKKFHFLKLIENKLFRSVLLSSARWRVCVTKVTVSVHLGNVISLRSFTSSLASLFESKG